MRWDRLFDDLEGQLAAQHLLERFEHHFLVNILFACQGPFSRWGPDG